MANITPPLPTLILILLSYLNLVLAVPNPTHSNPDRITKRDTSNGSWPTGKQVGVVVGCVIGGGVILFLWGWLLKGSKMFHGEKILWARSHFSFSREGREEARRIRGENKARRRKERERIWGTRGGAKGFELGSVQEQGVVRGEGLGKGDGSSHVKENEG